jgi:hypothetical protein
MIPYPTNVIPALHVVPYGYRMVSIRLSRGGSSSFIVKGGSMSSKAASIDHEG